MTSEDLSELICLLRRRLDTIADAELRERDPEGQLVLLREVSEAIEAFHARHRASIPPRLNHFLGNCSFQKALEWAESELGRVQG
jgi:hypothetical protein